MGGTRRGRGSCLDNQGLNRGAAALLTCPLGNPVFEVAVRPPLTQQGEEFHLVFPLLQRVLLF